MVLYVALVVLVALVALLVLLSHLATIAMLGTFLGPTAVARTRIMLGHLHWLHWLHGLYCYCGLVQICTVEGQRRLGMGV